MDEEGGLSDKELRYQGKVGEGEGPICLRLGATMSERAFVSWAFWVDRGRALRLIWGRVRPLLGETVC